MCWFCTELKINYLRCVGAAGTPHRVHQRRVCQPVPIPLPHQDQNSWGHQRSLSPRDWAPPWGRREAKAKPRGGPAARPGWAGPIRQGRAVGSWRPALTGPCWGPRTDMAAWAMWETQGPDRDRQSWQCLRAMVAKININMQHLSHRPLCPSLSFFSFPPPSSEQELIEDAFFFFLWAVFPLRRVRSHPVATTGASTILTEKEERPQDTHSSVTTTCNPIKLSYL